MLRNHAASGFALPNRQMGTRVEESFERRYALRPRRRILKQSAHWWGAEITAFQ